MKDTITIIYDSAEGRTFQITGTQEKWEAYTPRGEYGPVDDGGCDAEISTITEIYFNDKGFAFRHAKRTMDELITAVGTEGLEKIDDQLRNADPEDESPEDYGFTPDRDDEDIPKRIQRYGVDF